MTLLGTVKQRYSRVGSVGHYFTLVHRKPAQQPSPKIDKQKKSGILNFFRPQLSTIAKKILEDVDAILTRWSQKQNVTFRTEMGKEIKNQILPIKDYSIRTDKTQREYARSTDKRIDLVLAETRSNIKKLQRNAQQAEKREAARKREIEAAPLESLPISVKDTRRMIEGRLKETDTQTQFDIKMSAQKSIRDAVRRVREEDEYMKMRRGGKW